MRVNRDMAGLVAEAERVRLATQQAFHKLLEEKATLRGFISSSQTQFAIVLREHRIAGWFQEDDGNITRNAGRGRPANPQAGSPPHICGLPIADCGFGLIEELEIVSAQTRGFVEVALAKGRAAATASGARKQNFKTRRFQHGQCGPANVRFIIAHEGVVPENHRPARGSVRQFIAASH